ncbi:UNVERIFIED_ORG: hypothetical protein GGI57_002825 [Rhizobium aethiopicum]
MLVGAHGGGIQHHIFIVVIGGQVFEYTLADAAFAPSAHPLVDDLPVSEPLREIAPGYSGTVSVKHSFHEQAIIGRRAANMTFPGLARCCGQVKGAGSKIVDGRKDPGTGMHDCSSPG